MWRAGGDGCFGDGGGGSGRDTSSLYGLDDEGRLIHPVATSVQTEQGALCAIGHRHAR